jgi:hypothetical protein
MWARFRARTVPRPVSGQLCETTNGGLIDLISVSCRLSTAGIRFLGILSRQWNWSIVTSGLPPPSMAWRTLTGFPCSARMRRDWDWVPPVPRGRWCPARPHTILGRHPPPSNGRSLSPWCRSPSQDVQLTRHQRGFTSIHPVPSLPLACGPRTEREPLGFPMSFAPDRRWPQQSRTSRWGQVSDTDPDYVFSIG